MRVVLALDKFKGTFSARQACEHVAEGIRNGNPKIDVDLRPMADGGEGSAALLSAALGLEAMRVEVPDLVGRPVEAFVHWHNTRRVAVIESAEVLGIHRSIARPDVLLRSSSLGFGRLLQRALDLRPQEVWIGIGGTMTADGGWGLASAFGFQALDADGQVLTPCLENMPRVATIRAPDSMPDYVSRVSFIAMCDVNAPAVGGPVSLASFLAQKGATNQMTDEIMRSLSNFWACLRAASTRVPTLEQAYMGAGGGLGLGLSLALPKLSFELGAQRIARVSALGACIQGADLVVCGEGCLDELTLYGKAASVVSQLALDARVPLVGVFGKVVGDAEALKRKLGLERVLRLFETPPAVPTTDLVRFSRQRFQDIGVELARALDPGMGQRRAR